MVNSQKFPTERGIDDLADNLYHAYFGMKLGDHDQSWTPHIVCKTCLEHSRQWENDKRNSLRFSVLVIWLEPQNHQDDCYFCAFNSVGGLNKRTKKSTNISHPSLKSAVRSAAHSDDIPIPVFK